MRARYQLVWLLLILAGTSSGVRAEERTYDFTGFFGSRTFLPYDAPPEAAWPSPGEEFTGSITIDTDYFDVGGLENGTATFANAITSMEVEIGSPDQRFTFKRNVNGTGFVSVNTGTHPGQSNNSGMQSINAAVQGDLADNALGTISMALLGRAANRPIFNNGDVATWDLTDIPAQLWDLRMQAPANAQISQPLLTIGRLASLTRRLNSQSGTDTYAGADFPSQNPSQPSGAQWTGTPGTWTTVNSNSANVYYTDSSFAPFAMSLSIQPLAPIAGDAPWIPGFSLVAGVRTDYTFSGEISSTWRGSANTLGAAYNVVDSQNFYELRLYPAGYATLSRVINGKRLAFASALLPASARVPACPVNTPNCLTGIDAKFEISRSDYNTTVKVNGVVLFQNIRQTELGAGQVGPTSSYNSIKFRNFKFVANVPKLFSTQPNAVFLTASYLIFPYDAAVFKPLAGSWSTGVSPTYAYVSDAQPLALSRFYPTQGSNVIPPDYFLNTNLLTSTSTSTSSTSAGLAYEVVDAHNYYDVALGDNGTATLYQTLAGVRTAVVSAPWQGGLSREIQLGVIRFQNKTSVEVDGQRIFNEVPQVPLALHEPGVTSNNTDAYFNFVSEYYFWK